jgi:hypothetical protein
MQVERKAKKVVSEVAFAREMGLLNQYEKIKTRTKQHTKMQKCIFDNLFMENLLLGKKVAKQQKRSVSQVCEEAI